MWRCRYELCPLGRVTQQEISRAPRGKSRGESGSSGTVYVLGEVWAWANGGARGFDGKLRLSVSSGANARVCPEVGWARSAEVLLTCGPTDALVRADELETCRYSFELETPAACADDLVAKTPHDATTAEGGNSLLAGHRQETPSLSALMARTMVGRSQDMVQEPVATLTSRPSQLHVVFPNVEDFGTRTTLRQSVSQGAREARAAAERHSENEPLLMH
jgi:hypothetical protein